MLQWTDTSLASMYRHIYHLLLPLFHWLQRVLIYNVIICFIFDFSISFCVVNVNTK